MKRASVPRYRSDAGGARRSSCSGPARRSGCLRRFVVGRPAGVRDVCARAFGASRDRSSRLGPFVAAAQRDEVEATEQIRIEAPAGVAFTFPLVRQEPPATSTGVRDLGSDPSLGEALNSARTTGQPRLSAPVRLPGDGRIGVYAFVPVFAKGLPLRTRDAAPSRPERARLRRDRLERAGPRRPERICPTGSTCASPTARPCSPRAPAAARSPSQSSVDRTWRVSFAPASPSPVAPIGTAFAGAALMLLLVGASLRLRRRAASRGCARDYPRARAEDLRPRTGPRRVDDRRGAADAPALRGRERRARPRGRPRRPDQVVLGRSRAAARLHGRRSSSASRSTRSCTRTICSRPRTAHSAMRARTAPTSCSKAAGSPAATSSGSSPASSPSSAARPP